MSDDSLSVRHRSAPPAERPRGVWLAPIKGVFYSPLERWANPFEEDSFECDVEPGIKWRSTTEEDRALLTDWFNFFKDAHPKNERERMTGAATVLRSTDPAFLDAPTEGPSRVIAFIIALSLRTRAPLSAQVLRFELEETQEGRLLPHSGHLPTKTIHLPGWPGQQELGRSELEAVPDTHAAVWKVFQVPIEHSMRRCLGAYRAAIASVGFIDAVPVLSCAALEALAGTDKSGKVIERLCRYSSADDAASRLASFYRLRQWFAHGADIPEMRDGAVRIRTVEDGLSLVKEIVLAAVNDRALFEAATAGMKAVRAYLDAEEELDAGT